jgi:hypothetical protein
VPAKTALLPPIDQVAAFAPQVTASVTVPRAPILPESARSTISVAVPPPPMVPEKSAADAAPEVVASTGSAPHPAAVVSLPPPGRDSRPMDVLSNWAWKTDSHAVVSEDEEELYVQPPSRRPLLYMIGGGFALALIVTVIAVGFGGSSKSKAQPKPAPAAATQEAAQSAQPAVAMVGSATAAVGSGSAAVAETGSGSAAVAETGSGSGSGTGSGSGSGSGSGAPAPEPDLMTPTKDVLPQFGDAGVKVEAQGPAPRMATLPGIGKSRAASDALFDVLGEGETSKKIYQTVDKEGGVRYFVIALVEKTQPKVADFEKEADADLDELREQRAAETLDGWLKDKCESLAKDGKIKVNQELLRETDDKGNLIQTQYHPCMTFQ